MNNPSRKSGKETSAPAADKTSAPAPAADRPAAAKITQRPSAAFEDAQAEFFHDVCEPVRGALQSQQEAYREYVQSVRGIYEEGCRRLEEASRRYLQELQSAQEAEDPRQTALDAYRNLVHAQQTAFGPGDYLKLADAHAAYRQAVARSFDPQAARGQSREAFRRYLQAVKRAWSQVDSDSLDASSLLAISNSLSAVAWKAARG